MNKSICKFCNSNLSTPQNLTRHIKESKKCIAIQNKKIECKGCLLTLSKDDFLLHYTKCSQNKIEELKTSISQKEKVIKEQEVKFKLLEKELEIYKKIVEKENKKIVLQPQKVQEIITNNDKKLTLLEQPRLIQDTKFKLKLLNNNILDISIRKDGYINATQLCKAGNKLFGHYQTSKQTQDYLQALSSIIGIPILDLLDSKVGGSHSGTYVHRKVAYHLAQWISPHFAVQVSNVLDELMLTGRVELGKEKTNEELEMIQEQRLSIGIEPYLTNDITYIFEFTPEKEHLKNSELLNDKNIHFFEIGVTSDIKERKKAYSGYKLLKVFVYSSRQKAAMAESYMKNIVVELKMTLEYKNKKECMFGTYEDLDRFIEIISEHNLNGNKEPEEEKHNNNIEMYKIQTDKEIEIKRIESEMEMEIQKNKQTSIMSLFERKLITFEQFNESFQKI